MTTAQAAVLRSGQGPYTIEDVTLDAPGDNDVIVRIVTAGFCHSDTLPRMEPFPVQPPLITGHEGAGTVEWVGPSVTDVAIGDHVILSFAHCGTCSQCSSGHPGYCTTFMELNLFGRSANGGLGAIDSDGKELGARWFGQSSFATRAVVSSRNVVVVDADLDFQLIAPFGCGVITGAGSVLNAFQIPAESSIVIFGVGSVGLSALMAAKAAGANKIIAVDLHPSRLELASELGATSTFLASDPDVVNQVQSTTSGGTQYSFDTTGLPSVILSAIQSLGPGGTCGMVAVQAGDLVLDPNVLNGKRLMSIIEGDSRPRTFIPHLIDLWRAGRFPVDRLITTFDFDKINDAEQGSLSGHVIKPVLVMP